MLSKIQNNQVARPISLEFMGFGTHIQSTQSTSQDIIESNIIIVEPICSDDKIKIFFNNDLLLAKSLNNSIII